MDIDRRTRSDLTEKHFNLLLGLKDTPLDISHFNALLKVKKNLNLRMAMRQKLFFIYFADKKIN